VNRPASRATASWPGVGTVDGGPVATTPHEVQTLAAACDDTGALDRTIAGCRACPRLVAWREAVAATKRAAFATQSYWGRPVAGFGPADARIAILGLAPAAHGGNRTGRVFTGDRSGDVLYAALYRACRPTTAWPSATPAFSRRFAARRPTTSPPRPNGTRARRSSSARSL
jgi:uracil-DNA glycosylase